MPVKKWTVMLIPHDRGGTRTLTLSSLHFWLVVAVVAALSFSTAFLARYNYALRGQARDLHQQNRMLEVENARKQVAVIPPKTDDTKLRDLEGRLRAEYEASIGAITAELGDLYDMEAKVRDITDMAPRSAKAIDEVGGIDGGKGGPPDGGDSFAFDAGSLLTLPPDVIYGMSRPPADLILEEIALRTLSLGELVNDLEAERDRVARIPSIWPLAGGHGRINSSFGYRRDPFSGRIRHHSGTDISGRSGTKVLATAKGVVKESVWDRWFGNVIKIDHGNGLETWYAHLRKRAARTGEAVERGEVIGYLGSTGRSTGPHLHYEVHVGGRAVDAQARNYLSD